MGTYAALITAVQGLAITGIKRHYEEPPQALSTADLPADFPLMPSGSLGAPTVSCFAQDKRRAIQYVIAVEAVGQGTVSQNYGKLATLMDNLESALDALAVHQGGTLSNWVDYEITTGTTIDVAGIEYWSIVANVTARDAP